MSGFDKPRDFDVSELSDSKGPIIIRGDLGAGEAFEVAQRLHEATGRFVFVLGDDTEVSEFDVCVIHLATRAVEEDPSVCWKYEGTDDCRFTTTHPTNWQFDQPAVAFGPSSATLPCPECEGKGTVRLCSLCKEAHRGVPPYIGCAVGEKPCPSCSGSGVVLQAKGSDDE